MEYFHADLSENNKKTWEYKVYLIEGSRCILEKKAWSIDA